MIGAVPEALAAWERLAADLPAKVAQADRGDGLLYVLEAEAACARYQEEKRKAQEGTP